MAKLTGRVEVIVNGETLLNKAGAVASGIGLSGQVNYEREPIMGDTGVLGYKETPVPAKLEVTVTDRDDVNLDTFAQIFQNGTVIFRSVGSGKVYTMNEATCGNNFSLTAGEGEVKLMFFGPYWTEGTY